MKKLLIGTGNKGKIAEMRSFLGGLNIELVDLSHFDYIDKPAEIGSSFKENAEIKAHAYSVATGCHTVADDSGLEVVALGHRPGIFSARFAGKDATDQENITKLLEEIALSGVRDRSARFVCSICLADPDGQTIYSNTSYCEGKISVNPIGHNGFGYDPIFIPHGWEQSFGELPEAVKQSISHRALAVRKLVEFLTLNSGVLA